MAPGFLPFVHIFTAVLCVIELGLMANVVSAWYSAPSQEGFMLFNSVWSLLVLAYVGFIPIYYTRFFHRLASLILLGVTTLFWFAGSIAYAVLVGPARNCGADTYCGSLEASVAFGFIIWALFTFLLVLDTLEAMRTGDHRARSTGTAPKPYVGA